MAVATGFSGLPGGLVPVAQAQSFSFSSVKIEGNDRIEPATIVKLAGISRGKPISAAALNDAYQHIMASGLFESAELVPSGSTLVIRVTENPSINAVSFEGNRRIKDEDLAKIAKSQERRVYSPTQAEQDAAAIAQAYADAGRMAARVEPRIIKRDGNRVDLVFEIREGKVSEIERLSFTGNRSFSDRRLRQVLQTKQAGILHNLIKRDTYVPDRVDLDKQLLTDFYRSRGYIDAQVLGVATEFSRERNGFFMTYNVREGQPYKIAHVDTISEYPGVDPAAYAKEVRVRPGVTYSPSIIDDTITRLEGVGQKQGATFLNIEPRIKKNAADGTLDVTFVLSKGPRVFVERIDIEGNATTLDQVIRRQFKTVEGDPLNPREIRQAAERIRALGYFKTADVNAKQGTSPDQVIVDVNVDEQPTGSLSFGATYGAVNGVGVTVSYNESNFLGRGQTLNLQLTTGVSSSDSSVLFVEPAFLNRDLKFRFSGNYNTSNAQNEDYDTKVFGVSPALDFPVGEKTRLELRYGVTDRQMSNYTGTSSLIAAETARGAEVASKLGYTLSYDSRIIGLNPNNKILIRFSQDYAGLGGDTKAVNTGFVATAETKILNEDVTLHADFEGGVISSLNGTSSRAIDRFSGNGKVRGFKPNGYGPRDLGASSRDATGGNYYISARLEAQFPVGLPEEYGITGGLFADVGSVWGLDNAGTIDDSLHLRSSVGISVFWNTPVGPLRFNFAKALKKESYDQTQTFDLTVSTKF